MTDFLDVSFLILLKIDSVSREENLRTIIKYIHKHFNSKILLLEVGTSPKYNSDGQIPVDYQFEFDNNEILYATKFRNVLIKKCKTPYFIMYDTDIILPVRQLRKTFQLLRKHPDLFIYPYDGRFFNVEGNIRSAYIDRMDEQVLIKNKAVLRLLFDNSYGGVFAVSKQTYIRCGLENENIKSWGPDDKERYKRVNRLEVPIKRISGPLFHLDHYRGLNSYHPEKNMAISNMEEYIKISLSNKNELEDYIKTWKWKNISFNQ